MGRYPSGSYALAVAFGAVTAVAALATLAGACALGSSGGGGEGAPLIPTADACSGLACKRVQCGGGRATRVTGRVTDPAGLRGLYDVAVYIPSGPIAPIQHGARCDRCAGRDVGAVVSTLTDAHGEFVLDDVPADFAVPIVVEIGGFRRVATTDIAPCTETRLADDAARLPRNASEGELPRIASTTGASDALECLLRNIGIDDAEFTSGDDDRGHVQLFRGKGGGGLSKIPVPNAADLWNDPARLARYDIVALSCEGDEALENKGGTDPLGRQSMHDYAGAGGHVFATHFQGTWLRTSPAPDFRDLATWDTTKDVGDAYAIDTSFPKGEAFAEWLVAVGASAELGKIRLDDVTFSLAGVKQPPAQSWIAKSETGRVRYFSFNTPIGTPREAQCGRVVFADLHAFGLGGSDFPAGCLTAPNALSPQQLALEFLLFDVFACVDDDRARPMPPR